MKTTLLLLGAIWVISVKGQSTLNADKERVKTAILLTENERYAEAIGSFNQLLLANPKDGFGNSCLESWV